MAPAMAYIDSTQRFTALGYTADIAPVLELATFVIGSIQRLHEIIDFASFWRRLALASLYVGIAVRRCGFKMSEQYRK